MQTHKIAHLLGDVDNESSKLATRKWYIINDQSNTDYGNGDENSATVKFETKVIKSNLYDYSDAYILVTGDIRVTGGNKNTKVAFKNCAPFTKCVTHINDEHVDDADNLDIVMSMYNLIEFSENYSDTSGSLWQFRRDESPVTNDRNPDNISVDNSTSFKYKSSFFKPLEAADNGGFKNVKTAVPLQYLSNFWRSLEMPLINCKIHLELNWTKDCVVSTIADTTFKITNTKFYIPIVNLSSKDNEKLVKLLEDGFNRPVYWNEYQTKIETKNLYKNNFTRFPLDAFFKELEDCLFLLLIILMVMLSSLKETITQNVLVDRRNFYDQPIN